MRPRQADFILAFFPSFLWAQPSLREDTTRTYVGKEVIVTATQGSGEVLEIPLAVSIVNMKALLSGRKLGLDEALSLVPGVFAQSRAGG